MSNFGVTPEGFRRPSFVEIRDALIEQARETLGPVNTGPESVVGELINIMAEREALFWDAQESTYHSQYPDSAAGRSLDGAVQLTGITRLTATRTSAVVALTGDPGTVIPEGSQASTDAGDVFELVEPVTLDGLGEGQGQMRALDAGPVLALAGTLTNIETPVSGWQSVSNPDDGTTGRPVESDPELRQRRAESLQVTGAGTVEAIRARLLQQVDDVSAVSIVENRTDVVDADGRPPHSFEAVVSGGTDLDVADLLWLVKPAGIETTGEITQIVQDTQGEDQVIQFSRPIPIYIWVNVTVTPNGVGTFPGDAEATIKSAIVEYGDSLGVSDNVIYQALFGPIYNNVPGIETVAIEVASSTDPLTVPATFASENISIGLNELSQWLDDRVEVTINV